MKEKEQHRTDDEIRDLILKYFYDKNANASSTFGKKKGAATTVSLIRKELKKAHGLSMQEVQRNLTYLVSQGWVEVITRSRAYKTPNGTLQPASTDYYRIGATGIDKIQGKSRYTRDKLSGINIGSMIGNNLVFSGDGNTVSAGFKDISDAITELREAAVKSELISPEKKIELVSDLASIQDQLTKDAPNRSAISALWKGVSWLSDIDGFSNLMAKAGMLVMRVSDIINP